MEGWNAKKFEIVDVHQDLHSARSPRWDHEHPIERAFTNFPLEMIHMQPYLTNLVNKLMGQRSETGTGERRFSDIGHLVDQAFLKIQKRNDTALTDQILVANMLSESGQGLPELEEQKNLE